MKNPLAPETVSRNKYIAIVYQFQYADSSPGVEGMQGESVDKAIRVLEKLGHRLTPQRVLVTKIILENVKNHPTFKEIHKLASENLPRLGVSTTYTIMKMLEEAGLIRTFEIDGETHIDSPEPHVNLYCEDTGKIIDLDEPVILETLINVLKQKGVNDPAPIIIIKAHCNSTIEN